MHSKFILVTHVSKKLN